ncbi:MAG: septal ring lytic transglycosylase RlpA family protein [Xanthobacteraceae bacterium]
MRPFLFAAVSLGVFWAAGPGHAQTVDATALRTANIQIDEWSARQQHHHHYRHHVSRHGTSRGFAWFLANPVRSSAQGACGGSRVVATWYQSGRRTASGAAFNPGGLTAAHRSLPFGSRVTVTNPRNGQSVTVTINDRGPFTRGVTLDLARGAARAIGMSGTQAVCMS